MKSDFTLCFGMTVIWSLFPQPFAFLHSFKRRIKCLLFKKKTEILFYSSQHTNPSITNADSIIPLSNVMNTTSICVHLTNDNTNDSSLMEKGKKCEKRARVRKQCIYLNVLFEVADWYDQTIQTSQTQTSHCSTDVKTGVTGEKRIHGKAHHLLEDINYQTTELFSIFHYIHILNC